MTFLADYSLEQLNNLLKNLGEPSFRAKQLFLASHSYKSYEQMTNIPKALKEKLLENEVNAPHDGEIVDVVVSKGQAVASNDLLITMK